MISSSFARERIALIANQFIFVQSMKINMFYVLPEARTGQIVNC